MDFLFVIVFNRIGLMQQSLLTLTVNLPHYEL
jgi:hypothetical protein